MLNHRISVNTNRRQFMNGSDYTILRELGKELAEIAALDIQSEKKELWKSLNGLKPVRSMVMIDQLPWHELNTNDELTLKCENEELRNIEDSIRKALYKWRNFPADMVVENYISLPKIIRGSRLGPAILEETAVTDAENQVISHHYIDQLPDDEAVGKLEMPVIEADEESDSQRLAQMQEIFDDIIPVKLTGDVLHMGLWDKITGIRGVDPIIYDVIDRPEFTLKIITKFVSMAMSMLDQYEKLNLLEPAAPLIHCTGAYTNELPGNDAAGQKITAKDVWAFGMAQIFAVVSPLMHDEFEIIPLLPLLHRFGLIYYGCCEPLDRKIDIIRKIKNCRKISISPWADKIRSAESIHGDYVFSYKPNPSFLSGSSFDPDVVRKDLKETLKICRDNNTSCELILKDISTVGYEPRRLVEWEKIAMDVVLDI